MELTPRAVGFLLVLTLAGCASPTDTGRGLPDGIAVLGDSISRATNVAGDGFGDQPVHAWATGTDRADGVESHYERLKALGADIVPFNDARSGARMVDLAQQAREAATQRAQYVVILLGANDVCAGTPANEFTGELALGAAALAPVGSNVFVLSVPDVTQLVSLFGDDATARAVWQAYRVCPRVLAPGADLEAARALTRAYNDALAAFALERGWGWDDGAVHAIAYARDDVSTIDYFHPSIAGQAKLAQVTWERSPYAAWPTS